MARHLSLPFIIGGVVILLAVGVVLAQYAGKQSVEKDTAALETISVLKEYSLRTVQTHKTATDCWTAINGSVYELTPWISAHPGGAEAIIALCGTDGSAAFNAQHGEQPNPEQALANFKIGTIAND